MPPLRLSLFFAIVLLLPALSLPLAFSSFYDLATSGSTTASRNLLGSGPNLSGGTAVTNGISVDSSLAPNWTVSGLVVFVPESTVGISVLFTLAPSTCIQGQYLLSAVPSGDTTRRCGVVCAGSSGSWLVWKLACEDSAGIDSDSVNFATLSGVVTAFGVRYFPYNGKIRLLVYVKYKSSSETTYTATLSTFGFAGFLPGAQLVYRPPESSLYYFGVISTNVTEDQFKSYVSTPDADTKAISCKNCLSSTSLTCATTLQMVPLTTREYFCTCAGNYGYDLSLQTCVAILVTSKCSLSCPYGCRKDNTAICKTSCPSDMTETIVNGELVACACADGTTFDSTARQCVAQKWTGASTDADSSAWQWATIIGCTVGTVLLIGLIVFVLVKRRAGQQVRVFEDNSNNPLEQPVQVQQPVSSAREGLKLEKVRLSAECKICYNPGKRLVALVPCGHAGVCEDCVLHIRECPFDRVPIQEWVVVTPEMKRQVEGLGMVVVTEEPVADAKLRGVDETEEKCETVTENTMSNRETKRRTVKRRPEGKNMVG